MRQLGVVYRGHHGFDEGDYMYSLLCLWLVRRAEMFADDRRVMMRELLINSPELIPCEHTEPEMIWRAHGNIIKCLLSTCRNRMSLSRTVFASSRNDRIACRDAVRRFADSWTIVMRYLNPAFVPEHYRPPTHNVVEQRIAAIGDRCVRCSVTNEQCCCTGLMRV